MKIRSTIDQKMTISCNYLINFKEFTVLGPFLGVLFRFIIHDDIKKPIKN